MENLSTVNATNYTSLCSNPMRSKPRTGTQGVPNGDTHRLFINSLRNAGVNGQAASYI